LLSPRALRFDPDGSRREGRVYKYDLSLPLTDMYELVDEMRARLAPLGAQTCAVDAL